MKLNYAAVEYESPECSVSVKVSETWVNREHLRKVFEGLLGSLELDEDRPATKGDAAKVANGQ